MAMTRRVAIPALLLGAGLLAIVLSQADLPATWAYLARLGWWGLGAMLVISAAALGLETLSWGLTFAVMPTSLMWWRRVGEVLLVGQAVELLSPAGAVTGDSLKAMLLRRHGVSVSDATASLVLSRTTDVISLLAFVVLGLGLMVAGGHLSGPIQLAAAGGLVVVLALAALLVAAQWHRPAARVGRWMTARSRSGGLATRVQQALDAVREVEDRLLAFYRKSPGRIVLSAAASFGEWLAGASMTYVVLAAFGTPVTLVEAVVIETVVLLVRTAFFFVPADLGTQDGALVVAAAALTGSGAAGLALAAVRRARDLMVIAVGLALGVRVWRDGRRARGQVADARGPDVG